jgi:hypothetical protein
MQAYLQLETLIQGWGMYHANESQIAQLRGIQTTIRRTIDVTTRMGELRKVDRLAEPTAAERS